MTSYKNILKHVQKWEGGLVYFPEEKQWTNRGVQWTTFQRLAPKLLGIENPQLDDLKNMTQEQGDKFIEYYWNKATNNNTINNQATANAFFEAYWGGGNSGIKWLQKKLGVWADGVVGKNTVAAANSVMPETMVEEILKRFQYLADTFPQRYGRFLKGWTNRYNDLYKISLPYFAYTLPEVQVTGKKKTT